MVLIISKNSIEQKVRDESALRKQHRQQVDNLKGGIYGRGKDRPAYGDYQLCRESEKFLKDMRRYPEARAEISKEYHKFQAKQRKYGDSVK
jgi:hypothetical protein